MQKEANIEKTNNEIKANIQSFLPNFSQNFQSVLIRFPSRRIFGELKVKITYQRFYITFIRYDSTLP